MAETLRQVHEACHKMAEGEQDANQLFGQALSDIHFGIKGWGQEGMMDPEYVMQQIKHPLFAGLKSGISTQHPTWAQYPGTTDWMTIIEGDYFDKEDDL